MTDRRPVVRLSINLAPDVAATLKAVAERKHLNVTNAVGQAIGLWVLISNERHAGNRIVVHEPNGVRRELILLGLDTDQ